MKKKLDWKNIEIASSEILERCEFSNNTINELTKAYQIPSKYKYSFYDSLIIASVLENNCSILYSEDMQHLQVIQEVLTIINPFKK